MSIETILGLVGAALGGGIITASLQHIRERRKTNAEGALLEQEVEGKAWGRFQAEIARLDAKITEQDKAIADCDADKTILKKKVNQQDNEIAYMRHRLNNEVHSTEVLLMIIESHADALPPAVVKAIAAVHKMRTEAQAFIAVERAANVQVRLDLETEQKEFDNESS